MGLVFTLRWCDASDVIAGVSQRDIQYTADSVQSWITLSRETTMYLGTIWVRNGEPVYPPSVLQDAFNTEGTSLHSI